MSSTDRIARDRVLADLATLGTASCDAVSLLTQARDLAVFADQVHGELARLAGIIEPRGDDYVDPHDVPALQSACRTEPASPLRPS